MAPRLFLLAFSFAHFLAAPPVAAQCQLCTTPPLPVPSQPPRPLTIEIDASLDFSTAAHRDSGQGSIEVDPATGQRRVTGGLVGLSGMALRGTVRITGQPFRQVRISLPTKVVMQSTLGATADITGIVADIGSIPVIGANGTLTFSFGGKMTVRGGAAGEFYGRIPISVDYQ